MPPQPCPSCFTVTKSAEVLAITVVSATEVVADLAQTKEIARATTVLCCLLGLRRVGESRTRDTQCSTNSQTVDLDELGHA